MDDINEQVVGFVDVNDILIDFDKVSYMEVTPEITPDIHTMQIYDKCLSIIMMCGNSITVRNKKAVTIYEDYKKYLIFKTQKLNEINKKGLKL